MCCPCAYGELCAASRRCSTSSHASTYSAEKLAATHHAIFTFEPVAIGVTDAVETASGSAQTCFCARALTATANFWVASVIGILCVGAQEVRPRDDRRAPRALRTLSVFAAPRSRRSRGLGDCSMPAAQRKVGRNHGVRPDVSPRQPSLFPPCQRRIPSTGFLSITPRAPQPVFRAQLQPHPGERIAIVGPSGAVRRRFAV